MLTRVVVGTAIFFAVTCQAFATDQREVEQTPLTAAPKEAPFFLFADTQVGFRYQFPSSEPGVQVQRRDGSYATRGIPKYITNVSHTNAWAYGTNFASLDILQSARQDPAGTTNVPGGFAEYRRGADEVYGLYRGTLSLNALTGTKAFTVPGIIKDVSLGAGFDANTKDTAFGPKKRSIVGGLTFAIDVPVGFLNVSANAYKEWNRNGFNLYPNRSVSFDTVPEFEIVYSFPLDFIPNVPLRLAGFNNIVLPKGRGVDDVSAFPFNPKTGVEFLSRTNLVLDVGKLVWGQPQKLDAFVGFEYWHNKFGNVERANFKGTEQKSFLVGVSAHVF